MKCRGSSNVLLNALIGGAIAFAILVLLDYFVRDSIRWDTAAGIGFGIALGTFVAGKISGRRKYEKDKKSLSS